MYSTYHGVLRKLKEDMYDESTIESKVYSTDPDVVAWINSVTQNTTDFTEIQLTTTHRDVRLASDCYGAYRIMSEMLEGVGYDTQSLAKVRYEEARQIISMWCANNGIIPAFDIVPPDGGIVGKEVVEYAYAVGSNEACIG